jgi:outer membrane immunogenic protein
LYGTGGYAYGRVNTDYSVGLLGGAAPLATVNVSSTQHGWTAGGGGEYRFAPNWSVKLEYLYLDLGSIGGSATSSVSTLPLIFTVGDFRFIGVSTTTTTGTLSTRFTDHILRGGINYRF